MKYIARLFKFKNIKIIHTANSHWSNVEFIFWAAKKTQFGSRFIVSEHGGSIPLKKYCFDFEENMQMLELPGQEEKIKQKQLPAIKLSGLRRTSLITYGSYCGVIGVDAPRYARRIQFAL